jgi:hypothetical protein
MGDAHIPIQGADVIRCMIDVCKFCKRRKPKLVRISLALGLSEKRVLLSLSQIYFIEGCDL